MPHHVTSVRVVNRVTKWRDTITPGARQVHPGLCCKSRFVSLITKLPGCRRDIQVDMWPHHPMMNSQATSLGPEDRP